MCAVGQLKMRYLQTTDEKKLCKIYTKKLEQEHMTVFVVKMKPYVV